MAARGVRFVFDEHFSKTQVAFVSSQSGLGYISHVRTHGWSATFDEVWIPIAVKMDLVIITADRNEKTRGFTVQDLKSMGARVSLIGGWWDKLGCWDKAKWLVGSAERLAYVSDEMPPGSVSLIRSRQCQFETL